MDRKQFLQDSDDSDPPTSPTAISGWASKGASSKRKRFSPARTSSRYNDDIATHSLSPNMLRQCDWVIGDTCEAKTKGRGWRVGTVDETLWASEKWIIFVKFDGEAESIRVDEQMLRHPEWTSSDVTNQDIKPRKSTKRTRPILSVEEDDEGQSNVPLLVRHGTLSPHRIADNKYKLHVPTEDGVRLSTRTGKRRLVRRNASSELENSADECSPIERNDDDDDDDDDDNDDDNSVERYSEEDDLEEIRQRYSSQASQSSAVALDTGRKNKVKTKKKLQAQDPLYCAFPDNIDDLDNPNASFDFKSYRKPTVKKKRSVFEPRMSPQKHHRHSDRHDDDDDDDDYDHDDGDDDDDAMTTSTTTSRCKGKAKSIHNTTSPSSSPPMRHRQTKNQKSKSKSKATHRSPPVTTRIQLASRNHDTEDSDSFEEDIVARSTKHVRSRHDNTNVDGDEVEDDDNDNDIKGNNNNNNNNNDGGHPFMVDKPTRPFQPNIKPGSPFEPCTLDDDPAIEVPPLFNQYLRDYQREGIEFMYNRLTSKRGGQGVVLADDMGLGKTVQVLGVLVAMFQLTGEHTDVYALQKRETRRDRDTPASAVLITCPSSVLYNWMSEIETWTHLRAEVVESKTMSAVLRKAHTGRLEVVLASYNMVAKNIDVFCAYSTRNSEGVSVHHERPWRLLVFDEAHKLKNHRGAMYKALMKFKIKPRVALTGTALQNKFQEYHTLHNFVNEGCFGTWKDFKFKYADPIANALKPTATANDIAKQRIAQQGLSERTKKYYLQRMKSVVIKDQLPKKTDEIVFCKLTRTQRSCYCNIINGSNVQNILKSVEPCDCDPPWRQRHDGDDAVVPSGETRQRCCYKYSDQHFVSVCRSGADCACDFPTSTWWEKCKKCHCENPQDPTIPGCIPIRFLIMQSITRLKQAANHLGLFLLNDKKSGGGDDEALSLTERNLEERNEMIFCGHEEFLEKDASMFTLSQPELCGKMKILVKLLQVWKEADSKVLIFSSFTRVLDLIQTKVQAAGYAYYRIDGSVSAKERMRLVKEFNTDVHTYIFLLSTGAGGEGLNLTAANKVVIFDPSWNPSRELQAQDRAFRFGQVRDVTVFRFISAGTIEEKIYVRQFLKQQLSSAAQTTEEQRRVFDYDDVAGIANLFRFDDDEYDTIKKLGDATLSERLETNGYAITGIGSKQDPVKIVPSQPDESQSQSQSQSQVDHTGVGAKEKNVLLECGVRHQIEHQGSLSKNTEKKHNRGHPRGVKSRFNNENNNKASMILVKEMFEELAKEKFGNSTTAFRQFRDLLLRTDESEITKMLTTRYSSKINEN